MNAALPKKTVRFATELSTAMQIQQIAMIKGIELHAIQAHAIWAEHSDNYCASWLDLLDWKEGPEGIVLAALSQYETRHGVIFRRVSVPIAKAISQA